jgi:hypothetical protein
MYVVHKLIAERVKELKSLDSYKNDRDYEIENTAADELVEYTRKMCRRAMIRNSFYMDWLMATLEDNAFKCYVAPFWIVFTALAFSA